MKMTITYENGQLEVQTHFPQNSFAEAREMIRRTREEMNRLLEKMEACPFYEEPPGLQVVKLRFAAECSVYNHDVNPETVQLPVYALEALSRYFSHLSHKQHIKTEGRDQHQGEGKNQADDFNH